MPEQGRKYNLMTLQPKDEKHVKPFYDFAMEDVKDVIPVFVLMSTLLYICQIIFAVQRQDFSEGIPLAYLTVEFILPTLEFVLYISLIPLKNYLRQKIVYYMLILCYLNLFGTYLQVVFEDK